MNVLFNARGATPVPVSTCSPIGMATIAVDEAGVIAPYLDPVNVWTWGFGHTKAAGEPDPERMPRGNAKDVDATIAKMIKLLDDRLDYYERQVARLVKVPLTQPQFDALTSFQYNTGGLGRSSGLGYLNRGDWAGAFHYFDQWVNGTVNGKRVRLNGLVARRKRERHLFFTGEYDQRKIPIIGVNSSNRPVYSKPLRYLHTDEFVHALGRNTFTPAAEPTTGLLSRFLSPAAKPGRIVGQTSNGLPIYANAADYPWDYARWPNFKPEEFACRGTGTIAVDPEFLDFLQAFRTLIGKAFYINSGYRSPQYNRTLNGAAKFSQHMLGLAVDISMNNHVRAAFVRAAIEFGFTGIGVYSTFVHLDRRTSRNPGKTSFWDQT